MSQDFVTPNSQSISSLLRMIMGDGLTVSDVDSTNPENCYLATYVNDNGDLVALCACDYPFVAYSGAALSLIPADVANEAINGRSITEVMIDNFHEVMNICSKLMMSNSSAHLRLDKILPPANSADAISALQAGSGQVFSFSVDIAGYGIGSLSFLID